jgi:tRNA U34 5-methylaminomethyl-2-thiouridine-forming methyltransferase MnmC
MKRELKITADGSSTLYIPEMDENYHSDHGALQEAMHVFIENGLNSIESEHIAVFEMGFGTGLNALLTSIQSKKQQKRISYVGIEAFPVSAEHIAEINYIELVGVDHAADFQQIHQSNWNEKININHNFEFTKVQDKIEDYSMPANEFDLIYYDAFGPRAQASMWEIPILEKMYKGLKPGGMLVTYCAQGQFKRNLKSLGFEVIPLPGPPGKREMTKGMKK